MEKNILKKHSSLSTRLSLLIVLFVAIILVASFSFMFGVSKQAIRQEAVNHATEILENTALRVNGILDKVVIAIDNTDWLVCRHLDSPDSMFVYSRRILQNNPILNGCSIAFEPNFFKEHGRYFSAYSYNDKGNILTIQEGSEHYEYFYMDWYQLCKLLDRPMWTEPFMDFDSEDLELYGFESYDMITSYCKPLKDKDGGYIGTISVDLSLSWLSKNISAIKPYPNSYSIMIGRGGTYFVHPDTTKLFYQTIFTETLENPDTAITALGHAMQHGEEGMRQLKVDGEDCFVFYKPLSAIGWSVAIVCPESDIFGSFNSVRRAVIVAVIVGLILMFLVCTRIIAKQLRPLKNLATQAGTIANGNFEETLPDDDRNDEIGQLSHSFSNMQRSLVKYIAELKQTTAQKASIESELKVASDIQMSMVPHNFPAFPDRHDIDLFASMTPAKEVGGDLYDFFIQNEHLYFCVGDVSGKGVPASLFMAVTRNLFRIVALEGHSPAEIATQINQIVSHNNELNMFVTMFVGCVDLKTGHLDYCNCGHNAPLIDGEFMNFKYTNMPLGIMEDVNFTGESMDDIRDRQIFVYTDGLNEAENSQHQIFGNERMHDLISKSQSLSSEQVVMMFQDAVEEHRGGVLPNDDLTLLCMKIKTQPKNEI